MATANNTSNESSISSDALALLDCFSCGFDEVLYQLAEHVAVSRSNKSVGVEINRDDISKAAVLFVDILKQSNLPEDVKAEVDEMLKCLSSKIQEHG